MYPAHYGDNPLFPSSENFQVVQRDGSFGMGVICYRPIKAGDLVAEFAGEIIYEMTQHTLQIEPGVHLLDLYFTGYFLHSCDPNVSVNMKERRVTALRDIAEFDFLQMDYAETEQTLYKQFPCSCGTANCRRWITGSSELANENNPAYFEFLQQTGLQVRA